MTSEDLPSILDAVRNEVHPIAADDEPQPDPHPEEGDVVDSESEYAVSLDARPELTDDDQHRAAKSPAEDLYDDSPTSNLNDDTDEEASELRRQRG